MGTPKTASVEWKLKVRARMEELGISRASMSRELKKLTGTGTPQSVTQLLGPEGGMPVESSTKLMPAYHKILGWPPPRDEGETDDESNALLNRLRRVWPDLSEPELDLIDMIVAKRDRRS